MKFKLPFSKLGQDIFLEAAQATRIVTAPNVVVTYTLAPAPNQPTKTLKSILHPETIDAQLLAILQANPDADLEKYEAVLGVKILNVQKKSSSLPPSQPPDAII